MRQELELEIVYLELEADFVFLCLEYEGHRHSQTINVEGEESNAKQNHLLLWRMKTTYLK